MSKKLMLVLAALLCVSVCGCTADKAEKTEKPTDADTQTSEVTEVDETDDEEEDEAEDEEEVVIKDDNYYLSDLSTESYDGYDFRILIRPGKTPDQWLEEDSDDPVQSAVYKRNKTVEDRYGITISATESSSSDYESDALNSILAGDDAYDIIFPHSRAAFTYAVQGAVYNINEIESIHLDKPWWSKDIYNSCNINGKLFVLDGDISMHRLEYAMCLCFNKRIFDELGYDYPYELVKDGEWTFDQFAYLVKKGGKDLNGDGVMTAEEDQFGYYATEWNGPIEILYTGGAKVYDKNDEGMLELTLYSNKTVQIFDSYFNLVDNDNVFMSNGAHRVSNFFSQGRAMFADSGLGSVKSLRDMDDDFGVVPYPKFTEEDEYATVVNGHAHLAVIPITVSDVERTGAIIEALCAYGSRDVLPAFYDVSLKTKYARDNDSEEMMDIIKDSIIYDIGYVAGGSFQSTGYDLANSATHDFASYYASRESSAQKALEKFNKDYGGIE